MGCILLLCAWVCVQYTLGCVLPVVCFYACGTIVWYCLLLCVCVQYNSLVLPASVRVCVSTIVWYCLLLCVWVQYNSLVLPASVRVGVSTIVWYCLLLCVCVQYKRAAEFRRLCDILRQHLTHLTK